MKYLRLATSIFSSILMALVLSFTLPSDAEYTSGTTQTTTRSEQKSDPNTGTVTTMDRSDTVTQMSKETAIDGSLVDQDRKAREKGATVKISVAGCQLTDPDTTDGRSQRGQCHLHYQLDNGPIIATTASKLSFHALSSGDHTINVMLAGNDHRALGPKKSFAVRIP